jgi:hypothetical protein
MQCKATSRAGHRCKQPAIDGGTVCRYHGGNAPQVKAAAARRLATLVDPAIAVLARLLRPRRGALTRLELDAARDVLDRNGFAAARAHRLVNEAGEDRGLTLADLDAMREDSPL